MERNCSIERLRELIESLNDDDICCNNRGAVCYIPSCTTEVECQMYQQHIINILHGHGIVGTVCINMCFRLNGESFEIDFYHCITLPTNKSDDTSTSGGAQRCTEH